MALTCLAWLFIRCRRLRRSKKFLVITLSCCSTLYFAFTPFKINDVTLTDDFSRNFTEGGLPTAGTRLEGKNHRQAMISDSVESFTKEVQRINQTRQERKNGQLTVKFWRDLCGDEVKVLQNWPFYPSFPDDTKLINEFQLEENKPEYGQTISGFIHPAKTGSYRFAIASDDSSELWLSKSEVPEEKQLIASVSSEGAAGWTKKNELDKYPNQVSREVELRNGSRYYIEVIHKQGAGDGFVQVFWLRPGETDFKLINSEFLSPFSDSIVGATKINAMKKLRAMRLAAAERTWKKYSNFFSLPLITEENYLPQCAYKSSFIVNETIGMENGVNLVHVSNVFPEDDTFMGKKEIGWSWGNRLADGEIVQSVVDKMITAICKKNAK